MTTPAARLAFCVCVLVAKAGHATPCADAFASASSDTQKALFVEARAALIRCSSDACPVAMRPLCADDLSKLEARIPSVVIAIVDAHGADVTDAAVTIDGQRIAAALDGKAVDLNPGSHVIRAEGHGTFAEQIIVARESEKARGVRLVLEVVRAASDFSPKVQSHRPLPASVWITSGITLAAAGVWIGFGASGLAQKSALDACKGMCSDASVSSARTAFGVADVAGLLTIVGLAVDIAVFATRPIVVVPAVSSNMAGLSARAVF